MKTSRYTEEQVAYTLGTLPRPTDHGMVDFPAPPTEWLCESPGSRKVRSSPC